MGTIRNLVVNTNMFNELEHPVIQLAKRDRQVIDTIAIYDDLSFVFNLNEFDTATFTVYREVDGAVQSCYELLEDGRLVLIQGLNWYEIHVAEDTDGATWKKAITCTSLEVMLSKKNLVDFECNTGEILYDGYVKTIFYDPGNPEGSLLDRILNVSSNWIVGHVDASLASKQRSFDVDNQDVYSFLTGDVSEAFECLFVFDTFSMTVNAYDLNSYGDNTHIYISQENYANQISVTTEDNAIFTCYRVYGGDGIYVNEVNPNGTNKIYDFSYYLPEMPQTLQDKVIAYNQKFTSLTASYLDIMSRMQACIDSILELQNRVPDDLTSTDWTLYGLSLLEAKQKAYENQNTIYKSLGADVSTSSSYSAYIANKALLDGVTAEVSVREGEIATKNTEYESIKVERNGIQSQLNMSTWYTKAEWKALDMYVNEETYTNENYIVTDQEDDSERFDITRQLYNKAVEDLHKKCRPQYQYSSDLDNLLLQPEFAEHIDDFALGNYIRLDTTFDDVIKLRLISINLDYSDQSGISVTFSDAVRVDDVYNDMSSIISQASSASTSFNFNKSQYDKASDEGNFVAEMRKYGLTAAAVSMSNAKNQSQTWDEYGMSFREWDESAQNYKPEQLKLINNLLCFTDDNWNSVKMALGKVEISQGTYAYGLNAEVVQGKLLLGENLTIANSSGTYTMNDDGFTATKDTISVKINPNTTDEVFAIKNGTDNLLYVDSTTKKLIFNGTLGATDGDFSGNISSASIESSTITGGSINIGNGTFAVDKYGNLTANSGTFSGSLSGATGTFSGSLSSGTSINSPNINGGIISGSTIISSYGSATASFVNGNLNVTDTNGSLKVGYDSSSSQLLLSFYKNNGAAYLDSSMHITAGEIYLDNGGQIVLHNNVGAKGVTITSYSITLNNSSVATLSDLSDYALNSSLSNYATTSSMKSYVQNYAMPAGTSTGSITASYGTWNSMETIRFSNKATYLASVVYSNFTRNSSSDPRYKTNINSLSDCSKFYLSLKPKSFNYIDGVLQNGSGTHYGLMATDVIQSLSECGIDYRTSNLIEEYQPSETSKEYTLTGGGKGLRIWYENLHAYHIAFGQELYHKIEQQNNTINELQGRIALLEQKING